MKNLLRISVAGASLLLILTYFFPLWSINLWAPQYPEGLSMKIWSYQVTGDIQTINILNHYIGMKAIDPEMFPEFKIFPYAFGFLILTGLLAAAVGRAWLMKTWVVLLLVFATGSMYDFYRWEYDYGNNLSEDAAIKMDDMVYTPPLIGSKEIMNITAESWPALGGLSVGASVMLAALGVLLEFLKSRKLGGGRSTVALFASFFLFS